MSSNIKCWRIFVALDGNTSGFTKRCASHLATCPGTELKALYCSDGRWNLFVGRSVAPNKQGAPGTAATQPRGGGDLSHVDAILEFVARICSNCGSVQRCTMLFACPSPPSYLAKSHTIHGLVVGKYDVEEGEGIQGRGGMWHCSEQLFGLRSLQICNTDSFLHALFQPTRYMQINK
jgi:hypothetical protein